MSEEKTGETLLTRDNWSEIRSVQIVMTIHAELEIERPLVDRQRGLFCGFR